MIMRAALMLLIAVAPASGAGAQQTGYRLPRETADLKPGAGADAVQANCGLCHSLDYIAMQPPQRGAAFWQASVTKMVRVYGAPIAPAHEQEIVDYLAANY